MFVNFRFKKARTGNKNTVGNNFHTFAHSHLSYVCYFTPAEKISFRNKKKIVKNICCPELPDHR